MEDSRLAQGRVDHGIQVGLHHKMDHWRESRDLLLKDTLTLIEYIITRHLHRLQKCNHKMKS